MTHLEPPGPPVPAGRLDAAIESVLRRLLAERRPEGFWEGRLSSSALSTATAVSALALAAGGEDRELLRRGTAWLGAHQNNDCGWGDTIDSPTNLSTTVLAVAALTLAGGDAAQDTVEQARSLIRRLAGDGPEQLVAAIGRIYGADRTFAVPILMNCALAGLVPWDQIPGLPFELAAVPHRWYRALRLHVVSYALPALIAIGLLVHERHAPRHPLTRWLRNAVRRRVLAKLQAIQPPGGGFLEATPLTSFVAMSLIPLLGCQHPVVAACLGFIRRSIRPDGSWPIDTNLSVWLTTAAVTAIAGAGALREIDTIAAAEWIGGQQCRRVHPYTKARPGGWSWTHHPGGVPDGDDTAGAMLALDALGTRDGLAAGAEWLLSLQNADGGWPTFCRGWGRLPFDRSTPDITAHALRALRRADPDRRQRRVQRAIARGVGYLGDRQQADGSWCPLWFGNQQHPGQSNPVLGTSLVLLAWEELDPRRPEALRGVAFLQQAQNSDGGWGGGQGSRSSIEETAVAVRALAGWTAVPGVSAALAGGVQYLIARVEQGGLEQPSPIGLYFSSLWYSERLYPITWTLGALGRARATLPPEAHRTQPVVVPQV